MVNLYVGITDYDWFRFLSALPGIDEVNFWQPVSFSPDVRKKRAGRNAVNLRRLVRRCGFGVGRCAWWLCRLGV